MVVSASLLVADLGIGVGAVSGSGFGGFLFIFYRGVHVVCLSISCLVCFFSGVSFFFLSFVVVEGFMFQFFICFCSFGLFLPFLCFTYIVVAFVICFVLYFFI